MGRILNQINSDEFLGDIKYQADVVSEGNQQILEQSCTVNGQSKVMNDLGIPVSEDAMAYHSHLQGYYDLPFEVKGLGGTLSSPNFQTNAQLIKEAGLPTEKLESFGEMDNALVSGKRVLLSVDSSELDKGSTIESGYEAPNHSVEVLKKVDNGYHIYNPKDGNEYFVDDEVLKQAATEPGFGGALVADSVPGPNTELSEEALESAQKFSEKIKAYPKEDVDDFVSKAQIQEYYEKEYEDISSVEDNENQGFHSGGEAADHSNVEIDSPEEIIDGYSNLADMGAAGGLVALATYFDGKPSQKKKIIQAGVAVGLLDSMLELDSDGLEFAVECPPILIASIFLGVVFVAENKKKSNSRFKSMALQAFQKSYPVIKYAAYTGLAAEAMFTLDSLAGVELEVVDGISEILEGVGIVADGSDILDAVATLGLSMLISKGISEYGKSVNDPIKKQIARLSEKITQKKEKGLLLTQDLPPQLLLGSYFEFNKMK